MDDRELLELAAKAAGYDKFPRHAEQMVESGWNPLTDDGDALRLARKLELDINQRVVGGTRYEVLPPGGPLTKEFYTESGSDESGVAMRRAIVCAAAEIGKETK